MSRIIPLRCIADPSGALTPLDVQDVPFRVRRVWFLHDIPEGARRGGHAHHRMQELVVAVSGSFDVRTFDGGWHTFHLNRATKGVYVPPNEWRYLTNFSSNAVALVLASTRYDPADYIMDFDTFGATLPEPKLDYFTRRSRASITGGTEAFMGEK